MLKSFPSSILVTRQSSQRGLGALVLVVISSQEVL